MENLPNPQSRIEELLNAFISGDTDNIVEPQSRIEDFWYFLIKGTNSLPIPQSRTEELMKKIIENDDKSIPLAYSRTEEFLIAMLTGEIDNLSKPESRKEEYLNYIARHNLIVGNIEYVTYKGTNIVAQNTVKKPFKSAILKGQTLVNLGLSNSITFKYNGEFLNKNLIKPDTEYTLIYEVASVTDNVTTTNVPMFTDTVLPFKVGTYKIKRTTVSSIDDTSFKIWGEGVDTRTITIKNLIVIEGDYTNQNIPYFAGMQSVKLPVLTTTGKNLFDLSKIELQSNSIVKTSLSDNGIKVELTTTGSWQSYASSNLIPVKPNTKYIGSYENIGILSNFTDFDPTIVECDINRLEIKRWYGKDTNKVFTTSGNTYFIKLAFRLRDTTPTGVGYINNIQLEEASTSTSYEPYKTNILSTPSDLVLRKIDDITVDELDLISGNHTQKVGEFKPTKTMLTLHGTTETCHRIRLNWSHLPNIKINWNSTKKLCNLLNNTGSEVNIGIFSHGLSQLFLLNVDINIAPTYDDAIQWLLDNDVTILYELETPVVKTVDLSIVDQDNNKVDKLSAFNDVTHIVSSSENGSLLAEVEVSVPTKMLESLNEVKTALADVKVESDIVGTAQKIQDVNSLNTMVALTEVYELALKIGDETK